MYLAVIVETGVMSQLWAASCLGDEDPTYKLRCSTALPQPIKALGMERVPHGDVPFGELHNRYAINYSSNNIQVHAMNAINVLLPPHCCMMNRSHLNNPRR